MWARPAASIERRERSWQQKGKQGQAKLFLSRNTDSEYFKVKERRPWGESLGVWTGECVGDAVPLEASCCSWVACPVGLQTWADDQPQEVWGEGRSFEQHRPWK